MAAQLTCLGFGKDDGSADWMVEGAKMAAQLTCWGRGKDGGSADLVGANRKVMLGRLV